MNQKVEVISIEKGIQISITADDPADIKAIQDYKQAYSDVIRDHGPRSEHATHHREHHRESHSHR